MTHIAHDEENAVDDPRAAIDQLAEATIAALRAPSILNTQPWRWALVNDTAELWIERDRRLTHLDPDGRLLTLSCGVALDHAVTALHAGGHAGEVVRFGDDSRPDLVATVRRGHPITPEWDRYQAIYTRRTDRRPFADEPPTDEHLAALRTAAERHGIHLHVVTHDQLTAFAAAVSKAGRIEHAEADLASDVHTWTTRPAVARDGVPLPTTAQPGERTVQPRDLSGDRPAGLSADATHDAGAAYLVLFADTDEPHDWLRAGEALSDVWLTLTAQGLAASPISEVVEVDATRVELRRLLGDIGYPMVAIRAGTPIEEQGRPPASPRRLASDVIELPR